MTVLAATVFGGTFLAAGWSMWATVAPSYARIVDLLRNGPPVLTKLAPPAPARSCLRNVTVRQMGSPAPLRAVA